VLFIIIGSGTVAALGVAFADYLTYLLPALGVVAQKSIAIATILAVTAFNYRGASTGAKVQNIFTVIKVGGLGLIVGILLLRGNPLEMWSTNFWPEDGFTFSWGPFGIALLGVLWAYEAWHTVSFSAGEFIHPKRDLPRSLAYGTAAIIGIYLITNLAYYGVMTGPEVAGTATVASTALTRVTGALAGAFVALLILTSIFGANNSELLTVPRVFYTMGKEKLFFPAFGRVHPRYRSPHIAILALGLWASVLTLLGNFGELLEYVVFVHWIFYAVTVAGVIVLRRKRPDLERPFRVPGYPWTPLLFVLASAGLIVNTIINHPGQSLIGLTFVLTGVPAYFIFRRMGAREASRPEGTS